MSDGDNNRLVQISTASSQASPVDCNRPIPTPNYFTSLDSSPTDQDMETDDPPDQLANKRKRADTNPEDINTPPSQCSFNTPLPQNPVPNQLGIPFFPPDEHSVFYLSAW
jgi:hypothetical protein